MNDGADVDLEGTIPWKSFLHDVSKVLTDAGIASAEAEARWLIEEVSGIEPAEWTSRGDELARSRAVASLEEMVHRRLAGEPIQYVLGHWAFRHLDLAVDGRVLIPRPETESIVDLVFDEVARLASEPPRVLDLGTGSGAIGLALASEHRSIEVVATDVSSEALGLARANLAGIGRGAVRVRLFEGSWFDALPTGWDHRFDVIVSNPPYVGRDEVLESSVRDWEPELALLADNAGMEHVEHLLAHAHDWLVPSGALVIEMASAQTSFAAESALRYGFVGVTVGKDLAGADRFVVARGNDR